jgi:OOP family OmpA-OmpF porin
MNLRSVLLAATVLALPAAAMAQPVNGPYVAGSLGGHWTQNIDVKSVTVSGLKASAGGATFNGGGGLAGTVAGGWGFANGLRAEIEGNWMGNHYHLTGTNGLHGGMNTDNYGVFANALYDFYIGWPVQPYVGVGIGYEWTSTHNGNLYDNFGDNITMTTNSSGSFAAQLKLGASLPIPSVPGLALTAEYRFMAGFNQISMKGIASVPGRGTAATSVKIGSQYDHALLVGVRYAFNAAPLPPPPAPAPVAAPAPAPARTYLVFFDWDKSNLSDRARQIIGEAAQNSTRVQVTRIEVSGYADRTGTAAYNMVLSRHRADNVAAELVRDGVPKNVIAIQAFGDTHLLVPTAAGVREPQNRRVEIVLK